MNSASSSLPNTFFLNNKNMKATIKEIARTLGLNPSTVSRALSGHPQVAESTREKVRCKAAELGYTPNLWAQNLVGAANNLIGCLVLEFSNPFYIPTVRAIEDCANEHDFMVFLGESRRDLANEMRAIERFRRTRVSGVIITPVLSNLEHLESLEKEGVPVVIAGRNCPSFHSINLDNFQSGRLAATFLIDQGYQKIGYVYSGDDFNIPEKERLAGLEERLRQAGRSLHTAYQVGSNRVEGGESAGEMWLKDRARPEALFCSNDLLAMGFIQKVIKHQVLVPDDVAVLGHDDIPFADHFIVPLSTIAFPKYEMGLKAMGCLLERINSKPGISEVCQQKLEPDLVIRQSA